MIINKNKTFPVSFENGKVLFYEIENPTLAKEGEEWDFQFLSEFPLNKKDKRGQEMFVRRVKLTDKHFLYSHPFVMKKNKK